MTRRFGCGMLSVCVVLAACSGSDDSDEPVLDSYFVISFSAMFSAFGGSHAYAVTPYVPGAASRSQDGDAPLASTLAWHVDEAFGSLEPFDALPAAIKLTTRGTGSAQVQAQGRLRSGTAFKSLAHLTITKANDADWDRGEARYHSGPRSSLASLARAIDDLDLDGGPTDCMPSDTQSDSACVGCHDDNSSSNFVAITPTQLAGSSDEDLIAIITQAKKLPGGTYNSPFLRNHPRPDCAFKKFHTLSVNEEDRIGLLLKLRSLKPQVAEYHEP